MFTTLAEVSLGDLPTFISIFATAGARMRQKHGSQRAEVLVSREDRSQAYVLIDWESEDHYGRFRADPEVPGTMKAGGIKAPPRFVPLERVAQFPA